VSGDITKSGASGQGGASAIALRGNALATGAGGLGQIAGLDLTFGASAGGITTGAYGIRINNLTNAVTIANTYGLYIGDLSTGTQTNTPYSIYASDTNTRNYLAGNLGVGTTAPGQKLDVSGEIELANYLYFGNAATEYLRWDGSSSFILTDDFIPSGSGYGLGSLSAYWGTAYLSALDISDGGGNAGVIQPLGSDMLSFGEFASYDFKDTGLTSFTTLSAPPAAAASGTVLNIKPVLTAMNGSDTVSLLGINASNADHTTGSNFLYGINVAGITADAEATEVGIFVDTGWDISAIFSGNVGIGDSTPDAKLELLSTTEQLRLTHTDGVDETNFTVDTDGNLTINNSGTKTMFSDDVQITGNDILDSSATTRISLGATTTLTNTTTTLSGTTTLTASSLATITTSSALSLGGATSLTFTSDNATIYGSDAANGNLTLHGTSNGTRTSSYVLLQPTAGNVGIGTTAPVTTLDIQGAPITDGALQFQTVIANSTTAYNSSPEAGLMFYNKYNSGGSYAGMGGISVGKENATDGNYSSYIAFHSRVNGFSVGERARITSAGNLGLGTTTASQTLHVEGTARITQSVSVADDRTLCTLSTSGDIELKNGACGTSSIRYKENVESLSYGLEQIQLMRPVFFNYKAYQEGDLTRTKRRVGFIAEEMDLIAPEVVIHDETGVIDGIDYAYLTAVLANGIQQQQAQIADQQAQLAVVTGAQQNLALNSAGQVTISKQNNDFVATATNTGVQMNNIAGFADVLAARLTAGLTTTRELIVQQSAQIANLSTDSITIAGQSLRDFVTGVVRDTVQQEDLVSPLAQVTLDEDESFTVTNPSGATIASIDATGKTKLGDLIVTGDASVSGTITSARLTALGELAADSASISGELVAESITAATISAESVRLATLEGRMAEFESIKAQTADLVNATVSGTLYANNIDGFGSKVAAAFDEPSLLEILLQKTGQSPAATESAAPENLEDLYETISTVGIDASSSAELNLTLADLDLTTEDATLTASAAFINDYLKVNGSAYINNSLAVRQNLFVGEGMHIADSLIEYNAAPGQPQILAIQPSGKGTLSLLAGLMELNETGQVNITGNLAVAGDVTVKGSLLSNLLQPAEYGNPFQVQVAGIATESGQVKESRFEIINELGAPVATISAQGRAAFAGGIGVGSESLSAPANETDAVTANKTSGKAAIAANIKEVIIKSEHLTSSSLIYVTPVGSTENKVLYVKSQTAENGDTDGKEGQFVVGFDEAIGREVQFNWWVIN
ncbi:tail fiber domain-containing protein, partial [Candidatus Woesebacteria bacterium]|nr:tail fiber domain-containing protein [Candidatus Woesebacteria bacterium]